MNEVLRVLLNGGDEEDALRRSFDAAAQGFGADKALLLLVEGGAAAAPLPVRARPHREPGRACERGESVRGVSASVIRAVVAGGARRRSRTLLTADEDETPALVGQNYSVLCSPVLDPLRDGVLAVMYFQNSGEAVPTPSDAVWLEGYASALGQAFALYFQEQRASGS